MHFHNVLNNLFTFVHVSAFICSLVVLNIALFDGVSSESNSLDYINFIRGTYGKNLSAYAAERGLAHFESNFRC